MSEPEDTQQVSDSIELKEVAPKPKRVYKKKTIEPPPPSVASTPTPVIKEKKARTQKQIDAFNKMREAYLNKHKTPVVEPGPSLAGNANVIAPLDVPPVSNDSPKGMTQHVSVKEEPYELGTKKVQKPRAKKNKQVELNQEVNESPPVTQNVHANQVINNSPTPPPVAIPKVSTAPRFVFV
jgi:hypothetical protein